LSDTEKQELLKEKGYYQGGIDGDFGRLSNKALDDFIKAERLSKTADINAALQKEDYENVTVSFLKTGQYYSRVIPKKQIVIHHTAGGPSAWATKQWWDSNPSKVATDFIIDANGDVLRVMPKGYWGWHLGVGRADLDAASIGIEICNYGFLNKQGISFYNAYGGKVPYNKVYLLPHAWKGFWYFEKYTDMQLESLYELLKDLVEDYEIDFDKSTFHSGRGGVFDWSSAAMQGREGIYTHNSYLTYKTDAYPHHQLIDLLQEL